MKCPGEFDQRFSSAQLSPRAGNSGRRTNAALIEVSTGTRRVVAGCDGIYGNLGSGKNVRRLERSLKRIYTRDLKYL